MLRADRLGGEDLGEVGQVGGVFPGGDLGEAGSLVADGGQGQLPDRHPSARQSRLICPDSSTRDLAIPDLCASRTDAKDQILGGAIIRDDTPAHPPGEITTQAGPKSATTTGQTGASSGDHTQR